MKKRTIWILIILFLVGAGGGFFFFRSGKKTGPQFQTTTVDRGRIVARLMASGTLSPLVTVQVGSQVSGRIKSLSVDFNTRVKKGQLIAKIDPQIFEATVDQARANLLAGEANLTRAKVEADQAQRQYQRTKALAERKLVAPADEDSAKASMDSASAQVNSAQAVLGQSRAALNQARVNLAYTTIVSPIDGVVISRNVDVGQTVAASLQAPTLFTIAEDLSKMQIHTNVAEADIGRMKDQMPITFTVDAYPRQNFSGVVSQIRNAPQTLQNVVTYDVVIDVANQDLQLKPGMTANVTFVYAETDEVLCVPNAALRFRPTPELLASARQWAEKKAPTIPDKAASSADPPANGQQHNTTTPKRPRANTTTGASADPPAKPSSEKKQVWVLRNGVARPISIVVGISDGAKTEMISGPLREGDELITDTGSAETKSSTPRGFPPPGGGGGRGMMRRL